MNAAARNINQTNFFHGQLMSMRISFSSLVRLVLMIAVLLSALAVIYSTNYYRLTVNQLESAEHVAHQLSLQWGQLLLEQASLSTPSRVEVLASEQLEMVLPTTKKMIRIQTL